MFMEEYIGDLWVVYMRSASGRRGGIGGAGYVPNMYAYGMSDLR